MKDPDIDLQDQMNPKNFVNWTGKHIQSINVLYRGPNLYGRTAWMCRFRNCGHEKLIPALHLAKRIHLQCSICLDTNPMRASLKELRLEIDQRRKANHDERQKRRWNPDTIVTRFQTELLDWIEERLDVITTVHRPSRHANIGGSISRDVAAKETPARGIPEKGQTRLAKLSARNSDG